MVFGTKYFNGCSDGFCYSNTHNYLSISYGVAGALLLYCLRLLGVLTCGLSCFCSRNRVSKGDAKRKQGVVKTNGPFRKELKYY